MDFNKSLLANLKKIKKEYEQEKEKTSALENEIKNLKISLQNERSKYQRELMKFSEKIQSFKNIQKLYVSEKENSEKIEKDLIQKEAILKEYQNKIE